MMLRHADRFIRVAPALVALTLLVARAGEVHAHFAGGTPACDPATMPDPANLVSPCLIDGTGCAYVPAGMPDRPLRLRPDPSLFYAARGYDPVGPGREVDLRVRVPRSLADPAAPPALPVVIWSHGGASGSNAGHRKLSNWAEAVVAAGYVAINVGHTPRTDAERDALCAHLAIDVTDGSANDPERPTDSECDQFKFLGHDRPRDVATLVANLAAIEALLAPIGIALDETRIVIAGHSAGAGGTLMLAGAGRRMGPDMHYFPDVAHDPAEAPLAHAPVAFMAFSPQGPGSEGFEETSFDAMQAAPILTATGSGDDAGGEDPLLRREAHYHLIPATDRYQLYVCDARFKHTNYSLERPAPRAFKDLLIGAGLALLDGSVRGRPEALDWLASQNAAAKALGIAEWSVR
jgi:hypothetical protein